MNSEYFKRQYRDGRRNFDGLDLSGIDLSGIILRESTFNGAILDGAKFNNADLTGIKMNINFMQMEKLK